MRARIVDGVVIEILRSVNGFAIEDCFHPDVLAGTVPCDGNTKIGDTLPVAEESAPPEDPVPE